MQQQPESSSDREEDPEVLLMDEPQKRNENENSPVT